MNASTSYIVLSIAVLAVIALLFFFVGGKRKGGRLTPLAGLSFGIILAGLFFGGERQIGYGLIGVGIVLAIIDIFRKLRLAGPK